MKLGDICQLVRGNTYKSSLLSETEGPVLLGLGSIEKDGGFKRGSRKHYPGKSDSRIILHPGDLYVSLKDLTQECGLLGAISRVPADLSEGRLTQDTVKLELDSSIGEEGKLYVYWSLRTPQYRKYCRARGTGTTNMSLSRTDFLNWEIPPVSPTRSNLISTFELIDAKTEANAKLNGYLLECMKANYRTLFAYEQTAYGSIYDIADVVYGAAFKSALFNEDGNGYPLIRIRDLTTYEPQYWTDEAHPKRTFIEPGDVVAGMDAEFSPTFWLGEKAVLNQRVCLFRPAADTAVSPSYLLLALSPLLAFIQNYATGTTVAHMGKGDLEALEVPLPLESDLKKFNAVAEPMRKQIVHNALENKRLTALRDALLPKLMSGEIDVSEVDLTQLNSHLA